MQSSVKSLGLKVGSQAGGWYDLISISKIAFWLPQRRERDKGSETGVWQEWALVHWEMVETPIRTIAGKTEGSGCLPDWSHFSYVDGCFSCHVHFLKYTTTVIWIWTFGKTIESLKIHLELFFFFFWIFALWGDCNVTFSGCSHDTHCWPLTPLSSFPGRPIPPTSSSSLLPSAQLPSSHNPPPVSCQMPLLDSNTSHQIMDTNPDEEFSPNSYLLRACSGPQQASSSGKETVAWSCGVVCVMIWSLLRNDTSETRAGNDHLKKSGFFWIVYYIWIFSTDQVRMDIIKMLVLDFNVEITYLDSAFNYSHPKYLIYPPGSF